MCKVYSKHSHVFLMWERQENPTMGWRQLLTYNDIAGKLISNTKFYAYLFACFCLSVREYVDLS